MELAHMREPREKITVEFNRVQREALARLAEREELKLATLIRRIVVRHLAKDAAKALRQAAA
jgi:hypothetical protein